MILSFRTLLTGAVVLAASASFAVGQNTPEPKKDEKKQEAVATPALAFPKEGEQFATAEQVAEAAIVIYGFPAGRALLNQIRKTAIERGKISVVNGEGKTEQASYQRWTIRAESLDKEKIRFDQEFASARFALIYNDDRIFGIYNDAVFTPREDASRAFQNQIVRGLEALLRYKENGSKLELAGREKIMGVDFYLVDVIDKQDRRTRFFISSKRFRVMMLEYEDEGVKYRRKFYDYNYAQGTLVPFSSVLWAGDKIVEETEVSTITFGQTVDEGLFKAG